MKWYNWRKTRCNFLKPESGLKFRFKKKKDWQIQQHKVKSFCMVKKQYAHQKQRKKTSEKIYKWMSELVKFFYYSFNNELNPRSSAVPKT